MGVRSDIAFNIEFKKEDEDLVKSHLKAMLLESDMQDNLDIIKNLTLNTNASCEFICFQYIDEAIRYQYYEESIDNLIKYIDKINKELGKDYIFYEMLELCSEFIDIDQFGEQKTNKDHTNYYPNVIIGGVDFYNEEDISFLDWIGEKYNDKS
jgi:hypothetical protein